MKNRTWIFLAVLSIGVVLFAITTVTATALTPADTPLYTVRMEKASSGMHFSPAKTTFSYEADKGHNVNYDVSGNQCNSEAVETATECVISCIIGTCCDTCECTCVYSCSTCVSTCSSTCVSTCSSTCVNTCVTCVNTCPETCAATC